MKVFTIAQGRFHLKAADRLRESALRLGFDIEIVALDGPAPEDRKSIFLLKPAYISERLAEGDVLYVDADSVFHADPRPMLSQLSMDAAAYSPGQFRYVDGVVYCRQTDTARAWLDVWFQMYAESSAPFADYLMWNAAEKVGAAILPLPPTYCWNEAWSMKERYGNCDPIIQTNYRLEEIGKCCGQSPLPESLSSPVVDSPTGSSSPLQAAEIPQP